MYRPRQSKPMYYLDRDSSSRCIGTLATDDGSRGHHSREAWLRRPVRTSDMSTDGLMLKEVIVKPCSPAILMGANFAQHAKLVAEDQTAGCALRSSLLNPEKAQIPCIGRIRLLGSVVKGEWRSKSEFQVKKLYGNSKSEHLSHAQRNVSYPYRVQRDDNMNNFWEQIVSTVGYSSRDHSSSLSHQMSRLRRFGKSSSHHPYYGASVANQNKKRAFASETVNTKRMDSLVSFPNEADDLVKGICDVTVSRGIKSSIGIDGKVCNQIPCARMDVGSMTQPTCLVSLCSENRRDNFSVQKTMEFYLQTEKKFDCTVSKDCVARSQLQSPISVLENGMETESFSSGCCNQASADIHELHAQLNLTNFVTRESHGDDKLLMLGDDDAMLENDALELAEDIQVEFGDADERDYSYLFDILIASGIHTANQDRLYKVCYSLENPANPEVFDKLEKKYGIVGWTKPDRKFLFNLINSILSEVLAPSLDLCPWVKSEKRIGPMWGPEGLVEKVWQILEQKRSIFRAGKLRAKSYEWENWTHGIDAAGREISRVILDSLLEEIVVDLLQ